MSRLHLASSSEPLQQGTDIDALCQARISDAQFAYVWDETPMLENIAESMNALSACRKCLKAAGEVKLGKYLYCVKKGELAA